MDQSICENDNYTELYNICESLKRKDLDPALRYKLDLLEIFNIPFI